MSNTSGMQIAFFSDKSKAKAAQTRLIQMIGRTYEFPIQSTDKGFALCINRLNGEPVYSERIVLDDLINAICEGR